MIMLNRSNAPGQVAFVMIVNITERRNAIAFAPLFQTRGFQLLAYQVADGFGPIGIASRPYKLIKLFGELIIQ